MNEIVYKSVNKRMIEQMNKRTNEWNCYKFVNEWMNEWMNGQVNV